MEVKKYIIQEIEEQQLGWYGHGMRLQDDKLVKLRNVTKLGQGNAADEISHGMKELEPVWREEI
jgi:hypothetical protein